ncbi:MAG: 4-alpha-glucanotransferase [Bosea sp. (in: a-proteobacteria)]
MTDDALKQLARRAGVATEWRDQTGVERQVSPATLQAILAAIGLPAAAAGERRESLKEQAEERRSPRFVTARLGEPVLLAGVGAGLAQVEIALEDGSRSIAAARPGPEGLLLPAFATPGYHCAMLPEGPVTIAVAPPRCLTFPELNDGRSGWGLAAQIYALRSAGDGGIGHFGGVAALGRAAGALGADALAISPVHALYGADPHRFSPYSPSTRLFYNPLHADPAAVLPDGVVAEIAASVGLSEAMAELERLPRVDWARATPLKLKLLRAVYERLRDPEGGLDAARSAFANALTTATPLLRAHAVFEALHAAELAQDKAAWDWRSWRPAHRDPDSPAVAEFARAHAGEVDLQIFLQWLAGHSYTQAHRACREAGMKVGLIADLAIGMDSSGSHAWSRQDDVLVGLTVGAPPDYYAAQGQNWGLTTFSPRGLELSAYAPFIETLRASLRHVGGIRIDHVMGLDRLWLIPEGASALEGTYVSLPTEDLFALVALESWRHRAIVIGEDLGTLPHGFRERLQDRGIAGMRVLRFERDGDSYIPPTQWNAAAAALTSTHDLVPTAGWWAGSDLSGDDPRQQDVRARDRGLIWDAFRRAGAASGARPEPEDTDPVVDAAIRYVAASPCALKLIAIEDALGVREQPNVPGTTTEKPNWQHRLAGAADDLLADERVQARLKPLG